MTVYSPPYLYSLELPAALCRLMGSSHLLGPVCALAQPQPHKPACSRPPCIHIQMWPRRRFPSAHDVSSPSACRPYLDAEAAPPPPPMHLSTSPIGD